MGSRVPAQSLLHIEQLSSNPQLCKLRRGAVVHHHHGWIGVIYDDLQLRRRETGIDRNGDEATAKAGEQCSKELRRIAKSERDPVAGPATSAQQLQSKAAGARVEIL